jgi:hypothetical protein
MSTPCELDATIHSGPLVDGYLATEGAIAQAADQNTILVHSSVFGMSLPDRLFLFLHELAHLQQLTQPGNDPVRALEEEAWEAAHAWTAGRPYRIRGKVRQPLNALAIIQGGEKGHPFAPPWYESNPVEPSGNGSITVKSVTVIKDISLEAVMDAIIREKQTEIVVVTHGWSEGLAIPLVPGMAIPGGAQRQQIFPLSADRSFDDGGGFKTPVRSDKDVADQAHLSEQQVRTLRAKMNQIRSLTLEHVAFRSCDMGKSQESLQAFRNFFGAKSVSAPKLLDSYGQFSPAIGAGVEDWAKIKRKQGFHISVDRQVAFGTKKTDSPLSYKIVSKALDDKAFTAWVTAHVADRVGLNRVVVYHGMVDAGVASPEAPNVYFVRDKNFISNIAYYAGGSP